MNAREPPPVKKTKITLAPSATDTGYEPSIFEVSTLGAGHQLLAFSYNEDSQSFSVKGKIDKNCSLLPDDPVKFKEFLRLRTINESENTHKTKKSTTDDAMLQSGLRNREIDFAPPKAVEMRKRAIEMRKLKNMAGDGDSSHVQDKILDAFQKTELLTLKDLEAASECTEKELKEVLKGLAILHKKGSRKNFYELRTEYKDSTVGITSLSGVGVGNDYDDETMEYGSYSSSSSSSSGLNISGGGSGRN